MKQPDKSQSAALPANGTAARRSHAAAGATGRIFQVSPVPSGRDEVLALAMHFAKRFAATAGKEVPGFSEDAAGFLASRRWSLGDLTFRICRAVEENCGCLITAGDLADD